MPEDPPAVPETTCTPGPESSTPLMGGTLAGWLAEAARRAGPLPTLDLRGYDLVERLGAGGMGEVYRAGDPALGRDLAVKVIREEYRGQAEAEGRFLREARVTGSLQHPGIVPVHNLGRLADGRLH